MAHVFGLQKALMKRNGRDVCCSKEAKKSIMSICCSEEAESELRLPKQIKAKVSLVMCYFHGMGCEPEEVSYFLKAWVSCAEQAGQSPLVLSFAAPATLTTHRVRSGGPALLGMRCSEALELGGLGHCHRESRAWYTYQWCGSFTQSHLDVFCESQLEKVLASVQSHLDPWLHNNVCLAFAGSSQGGTVALALAIDLAIKGHSPTLTLLYHSTIMERHLQKALVVSPLWIHLQLATTDTVYCPKAARAQAERLMQAGHVVTIAQDTDDTWHGGDVELQPSLSVLRSYLLERKGA